jgi:transcription elongation GreA/GreB family factor
MARQTRTLPDKRAVHEALRDALRRAHATMVAAAKDAAAGATHEDSRAEGDKDMRGTEQSYVARGQAMRAEELADELGRLEASSPAPLGPDEPVRGGALVRVAIDGEERVLYLCGQGGGTVLDVDGMRVTVVTPSSPVGRALLGRRAGDDVEVLQRGARREGTIVAVG